MKYTNKELFGSKNPQSQANDVYICFQAKEAICRQNNVYVESKKLNDHKITGAIVAEVFKEKIEEVFKEKGLDTKYKISENNVYVAGCRVEFDFLILKKDAEKIEHLPIYPLDKVVAVLESKTYGVYTSYELGNKELRSGSKAFDELDKGKQEERLKRFDLYRLVNAFKDLHNRNNKVKLGYMSMSEQIPVYSDTYSNFIRFTEVFFKDAFNFYNISFNDFCYTYYAKAASTSTVKNHKLDRYSSNEDWIEFVCGLVK